MGASADGGGLRKCSWRQRVRGSSGAAAASTRAGADSWVRADRWVPRGGGGLVCTYKNYRVRSYWYRAFTNAAGCRSSNRRRGSGGSGSGGGDSGVFVGSPVRE